MSLRSRRWVASAMLLVAFLATGADFMTGQMLVLDGGELIR